MLIFNHVPFSLIGGIEMVDWVALRAAATEAMQRAYAPYSEFAVGAAGLVDDGRVVVGCNVENASYGLTLCAECGLVSALHASGGGRLVAVSCVDRQGRPLAMCGRCRQLVMEHGGPDCLVDAEPAPRRISELLPDTFALDSPGSSGRNREETSAASEAPPTSPARSASQPRGRTAGGEGTQR